MINSYCVYCEKYLGEIDVIEDTATGHQWIGIYGEGQKVCTGCDETKEEVIYSGNFGTELGEFLVTTAYEFLKDLVVGFVEENLSFIYE